MKRPPAPALISTAAGAPSTVMLSGLRQSNTSARASLRYSSSMPSATTRAPSSVALTSATIAAVELAVGCTSWRPAGTQVMSS